MATARPDLNSVQEDIFSTPEGGYTAMGNVLDNDDSIINWPDVTRVFTPNGTAYDPGVWVPGTYGRLFVATRGAYTYELNNDAVQFLAAGQTVTEIFPYEIKGFFPFETAASTLTITISGTNDAARVTVSGTVGYTENGGPTGIAPTLLVSDVDSTVLAGARVDIFAGIDDHGMIHDPNDVLSFVSQNGITGSFDAATGVLSLSGTASVAQYQAALRSVAYHNSGDDPLAGPRFVSFSPSDGLDGLGGLSGTVIVNVAAQNDAPDAVADVARVLSFGTASGQVLLNDTDLDGAVRTVRAVKGSEASVGAPATGTFGTLTLHSGGSYSYASTKAAGVLAGNVVHDAFTYTIADEHGALDTATLTIAVIGRSIGTDRDDVITGNSAGNTLRGRGGRDALNGGAGDDTLLGDFGDDRLNGGAGADKLIGDSGNDRLTGGLGQDTLTGGAGRDVFDFNFASESVRGALHDTVNFRHADGDRIDLRDIDASTHAAGNQAFTFIGAHAFTGHDGELRFRGGLLQGDINGDRIADFEVKIVGALFPGEMIV